ncbi:hypothetical protein VTJ04DRAFT_9983 [Mycothermus thermophilus]|uniref:uncharacterized protein n=1 Tax=Humicola insolens TaxID=85995 RepID=UPI0037430639
MDFRTPLLPRAGNGHIPQLIYYHHDERRRRRMRCLAVYLLFAVIITALSFITPPSHYVAVAAQVVRRHPLVGRWSVPTVQQQQHQERNTQDGDASSTSSAPSSTATVLKTFEVAQPVRMPDGPAESDGSTRHAWEYQPPLCTKLLMRHDFAWSYEAPFVGTYTPPDCEFNRVVLNFSAVVQGRQYDRLAIMYFGDIEVWRTSTAQPTPPPGISWIYLKDMTEYLSLWKQPQKLIFDLGNLINEKYTGIFNTTLTAIFYNNGDITTDQAPPSDLIIPISARRSAQDGVSRFTLPHENATNTLVLPRNIRRAVLTVSANGQASEEFWWSNVLSGDEHAFDPTAGELPGLSPFREVQVYIDGHLAGVQWPFPVIFTGGVVPALHRPIVGIHAFDLREHEIDISPFIPLLSDGREHTFTIRVAGIDTGADGKPVLTETVNDHWFVTGKIFLWLSDDNGVASSEDDGHSIIPSPAITTPPPLITLTRHLSQAPNGTNETLTFTLSVQRALLIASPSGRWSQALSYTNHAAVRNFGFTQANELSVTGSDVASKPGEISPYYQATYRYPVRCEYTWWYSPQGNLSISGTLAQGKRTAVRGKSVFATGLEAFASSGEAADPDVVGGTALLDTMRQGKAEYRQTADGMASTGWGEIRQGFWFGVVPGDRTASAEEETEWVNVDGLVNVDVLERGSSGLGKELYSRQVRSVNGTVVEDERRLAGRRVVKRSDGDDWRGIDGLAEYA